jgi:hypothetical protein
MINLSKVPLKFQFSKSDMICLKLFEVFGHQNFEAEDLSDNNLNESPSIIRLFLMISRLCSLLTIVFIFTFQMHQEEQPEIVKSNVLMRCIEMSVKFVTVFAIGYIIVTTFSSTQIIKQVYLNFKNNFNLIHNELSFIKVGERRNMNRRISNTLIRFMFIFTIFSLCHFGNILSYEKKYIKFFSYIPNVMLAMTFFHYVFMITMLNQNLETITSVISEIGKNYWMSKKFKKIIPIKFAENQTMRIVKVSRRIFNNAYKSSILINKVYGLFLFLAIYGLVINLIFAGYFTYSAISENDISSLLSNKFSFNFFQK